MAGFKGSLSVRGVALTTDDGTTFHLEPTTNGKGVRLYVVEPRADLDINQDPEFPSHAFIGVTRKEVK